MTCFTGHEGVDRILLQHIATPSAVLDPYCHTAATQPADRRLRELGYRLYPEAMYTYGVVAFVYEGREPNRLLHRLTSVLVEQALKHWLTYANIQPNWSTRSSEKPGVCKFEIRFTTRPGLSRMDLSVAGMEQVAPGVLAASQILGRHADWVLGGL